MYRVANGFNLADEACEDALYDVPVFREFRRIDLGTSGCRTPRPSSLGRHFRQHGCGLVPGDFVQHKRSPGQGHRP